MRTTILPVLLTLFSSSIHVQPFSPLVHTTKTTTTTTNAKNKKKNLANISKVGAASTKPARQAVMMH